MSNFTPLKFEKGGKIKSERKINIFKKKFFLIGNLVLIVLIAIIGQVYYYKNVFTIKQKAGGVKEWPPNGAECNLTNGKKSKIGGCVVYFCPEGCTSVCGESNPGVYWEFYDKCSDSLLGDYCGQIDTVDTEKTYCYPTKSTYKDSMIRCDSSCIKPPPKKEPTKTPTPTSFLTLTNTPTLTPTPSIIIPSIQPTNTPAPTNTPEPTNTSTPTPTTPPNQPTNTPVPTNTLTPTEIIVVRVTNTPIVSSPTNTPIQQIVETGDIRSSWVFAIPIGIILLGLLL